MDPNDVVSDYRELVDDSLAMWQETVDALKVDRLRKQASIDALLRIAVGWETFLSDWWIAAINRAPTAFSSGPPRQDVRGRPYQVGSQDGKTLTNKAKSQLEGKYQSRITASLKYNDLRVIEATKAIRDCVSHRSSSSVTVMNTALGVVPPVEGALRKGKTNVTLGGIGKHLYARRNPADDRRIVIYHRRLREIARLLRT
jgi:hypothetical protein